MTQTPKYTDHDGYLMPYAFPEENFSESLTYEAEKNDIFIATYPKCGTTLTQHMTYLLLNDGVPILPHERQNEMFPHLEEVGADYVKKKAVIRRNKRLIKTHLYHEMTPKSEDAKYIFVARNPKDCVVSFFHHTRGFPTCYFFEDGDFDVYFELFCEGRVDFGSYFHMLRSWLDRRDDDNVLFLTYEAMKADKAGVLKKIAKFIDEDLEKLLLENDGEIMKNVLHHSSLEEMKKDPLRWCSERKSEHTPFIRSGGVGKWDELLTKEQGERLDKMMREHFTIEELNLLGSKY